MSQMWLTVLLAIDVHAADDRDAVGRESATKMATVASFEGSGANSIQAMAVDANGNIFVAGTTSSPDFHVLNAAQPVMGEARIMATTDGGTTWKRVGNPPTDVLSTAADPTTPQVILASGIAGVYKSTDGGSTWRAVYTSPSGTYRCGGSVVVNPGNHLQAAALVGDGGFNTLLIRSLDGGETWTATNQRANCLSQPGNGGAQLLADPTGSGALMFINEAGSVTLSRDWGATFMQIPAPEAVYATAFDPSHAGSIYMVYWQDGRGTLLFSSDFGTTFTAKTVPSAYCSQIWTLAVDPDTPTTLVAGTTPCGFFKSLDGGLTWQANPSSNTFIPSGQTPFVILSHKCVGGGDMIAIGGAVPVFVGQTSTSADYGTTWATPRLTNVSSLSVTACTVYSTRSLASDAFVSKLAPDGTALWTTYLGGSNQDAPVALALDLYGNVYVTGNTSSPDFPSTVASIGTPGFDSIFVSKFSPNGTLLYSMVVGGDIGNGAGGLAVDGGQNAYILGTTSSALFPANAGTLATLSANSYTGFLMKLSPTGGLANATYLGTAYTVANGIVVNSAGQTILAGTGPIPGEPAQTSGPTLGFVADIDASETQVLSGIQFQGPWGAGPGVITMTADSGGNLYILGASYTPSLLLTPGAFNAGSPTPGCANVYLLKLHAPDWKIVYGALLGGMCLAQAAGSLAVGSDGTAYLGVEAGTGWPLKNPVTTGTSCLDYLFYVGNFAGGSAVAKLSPDGSSLELGTYLPACGSPGIAVASDGSLYVGVAGGASRSPARVLKLNPDSEALRKRR